MDNVIIQNYIDQLNQELSTGNALEHSYRPAFKTLIESLNSAITAVNEPSRSAHGSPDFVFKKKVNNDINLGYVETKDIYVNLDQIEKTEQLKRYLGYSNLLLTNYLEFRFFRNGEKYQTIKIAQLENSKLTTFEENFTLLDRELKAFLEGRPENITSAKRLAQIMGGKAARIRANVIQFFQKQDEKNNELKRIYTIIQKLLIHDLEIEKFADMYAQTLVYGLFVARYYDKTPDTFSRQEARDLIPASNPFLRHFFDHIAGPNFDSRLKYIVDELCDVFTVSDIQTIIQKHFNLLGESIDKDPIIHFYEDFLKEYDPELKKQMGAYYTPVPVVQFIVNAVDHVLRMEFNILDGLASAEKIDHQIIIQGRKAKQRLHRIQILDPAVGTATFLNESIKFIYKNFKNQEGIWASYVENELLPRVYGFELMMAPYTIAHLKLAMTLKEMGVEHFKKRLGVYLTNTLEEGFKIPDDLFSSLGLVEAISEEAKSASIIKQETPIMVVLGNPPYSGISSNMTPYANHLIDRYKVEPGGKQKLQERKHWLNDDYVKFIAFAQEMIDKTGEGIMAMITNHSYLDNPTFRGMRWSLAKSFSTIYVLDLHGNIKKKEVAPDGSKDENVFDIQQGVAIIIAIKNKEKGAKLADVYRGDIWGRRQSKFEKLLSSQMSDLTWEKINLDQNTLYFIKNQDEKIKKSYKEYIPVDELFPNNVTGIVTMGDGFVINQNREKLANRINSFINQKESEHELKLQYNLGKNYAKWILENKEKGLNFNEEDLIKISYRPFDTRWIYFNDKFVWRTRGQIMKNFISQENFGLITSRINRQASLGYVFISKDVCDFHILDNARDSTSSFPLYIYLESKQTNILNSPVRVSNLNKKLVIQLLKNLGQYTWIDDHILKKSERDVSPLDILDYVYALLHSPTYREKYKDFLKSEFPRIPAAKDSKSFWELTKLGERLRQLHLLMYPHALNYDTTFSISGENVIEKVEYVGDKVFINEGQYFGNVPKEIWQFYIGGYRPAYKWLNDRKGTKLNYEDITHYQKIIKVLVETDRIMKEIDQVIQF